MAVNIPGLAEFDVLEPVRQAKSTITDLTREGEKFYAKINGYRQLISDGLNFTSITSEVVSQLKAEGSSQANSATVVMKAMGTASVGVGKVFKQAASYAGPIGTALSMGATVVGYLAGLFGDSGEPPIPSVEGIDIDDFGLWIDEGIGTGRYLSTKYDRYAVVAADVLNDPTKIAGKHGPDVVGAREAVADAAIANLKLILEAHRDGKVDPRRFRSLCLILAALPADKLNPLLQGNIHPLDIPNFTHMVAYGVPRVQLRKALEAYGLWMLAEASNAAAGYDGCTKLWTGILDEPYLRERSNNKVGFVSKKADRVIWLTNVFGHERKSEKKLCDGIRIYERNLAARVKPGVHYEEDGAQRMVFQLPRTVIEDELAYFAAKGAPDFRVQPQGNITFKFTLDGSDTGYGLYWPKYDSAIIGMFNVVVNWAKTHGVPALNITYYEDLRRKKADIENQGDFAAKVASGASLPPNLIRNFMRKGREEARQENAKRRSRTKPKGSALVAGAVAAALLLS